MSDELRDAALEYHRLPTPGKISVTPTKPLATQRDLALAYSPGVAAACELIVADPDSAVDVTARGNLVAVVTNGTAVLGLGPIGPLAAKPVMEGKGVLFKKFAGIDVFDMELAELDPDRLVDIIAAMEPTFGAINLEDIKAPECFEVERKLQDRVKIPVMHDDQHGTAIVVGAAMVNALRVVGKNIGDVKLVASGAGAAALACLNLLVKLGVKRENVWVTDIKGLVYEGRTELMDEYKAIYAKQTDMRVLAEVIEGADIFLGLSAPRVLTAEMVDKMAPKPIVFALANPTPEILPDEVKSVRPDAIIATGRSDYPNQVNNVLVFPYIFRGALDVGATKINDEMKLACVYAIAGLAMAESDERVRAAYGTAPLTFGPEYLIPKPFDSRLIIKIAPAVARAAMESGVARRPIIDFDAYLDQLNQFVFRSGLVMKPVFDRARQDQRRIVYTEGEGRRVLHAVQTVVDEGLARPILIGRREVVEKRIHDLDLRLQIGEHFDLCDPEDDPRFNEYSKLYHSIMERAGVSPEYARTVVRTRNTVIGSLMVKRKEADGLVCGTIGRYDKHLSHILNIIGTRDGVKVPAAMNLLIMPAGTFFICDTYVTPDPTPEQICDMALLASEEVRRFGIEPKVAFLSHSNFGARQSASAIRQREALALLRERAPYLEAEGEMHGDAALDEDIRARIFPNSKLKGAANLLIMPTLDAANISFNLLKVAGDALSVGPILMGVAQPAHILTPSATVRNIVNITALAAVEAQMKR
ncbi:malic enzyme [Paramagnetospirillum marisnigri]|uniref:Malic enzyme n=1 Tax=Paramagnetospirillum marisnigri TaxID=1285242 RepID=A0A178MUT5_9PROT|nr:NADP-dependent malic enzyme [Paramagnetospirillum marisnigri]OAN52403.1 malic enzyme [Paramagnetospirillum marisnigri]